MTPHLDSNRCFILLLVLSTACLAAENRKVLVDYVDPNIGGVAQLLAATAPLVYLPFGMMQAAPITTPGIRDRYLADKIYGFPAGPASIMACTGIPSTSPDGCAAGFDHDLETASPYYYSAVLDNDITAEYTVTERAVVYRFKFPSTAKPHLAWTLQPGVEVAPVGLTALQGSGVTDGVRRYFYAEISQPFVAEPWSGTGVPRGRAAHSPGGLSMDFRSTHSAEIGVRLAISYISTDQARRNLIREMPDWNFEALKAQARSTWNQALGRILVQGGTEEQRTIFYTALYRSMARPMDITEEGRYYSGFDNAVHSAAGHEFYTNEVLWDSYRCLHPLQLILDEKRQEDIIWSYLQMYSQSGSIPRAPGLAGDGGYMIGYGAAAVVADTYAKGSRNFDLGAIYNALKKRAMEGTNLPWRSGTLTSLDRFYLGKGYFPSLAKGESESVSEVHPREKRQAVSVTLELSYDDWCLAQIAKTLNKQDDYTYFMKRSMNYRNVFNESIGFMAPKAADGNWVEEFDPKMSGGWGGRDYFAENNGWTYVFQVPHNISDLISLIGGKDKFVSKLDALFVEQYSGPKYKFLAQWDNMTGLIGQYAQGNEPGFEIPYLYNYAGQPWKTQQKVRQIMGLWYSGGPLGIPGDEDGGAMSSWYVLSAMGFYPVCPGKPVYDIGSPIFREIKIFGSREKVFTIVATDASKKNKYIQSAELDGEPLNHPWFTHDKLINGGTLTLHMGPRPNRGWAAAE